MSKRRLPKRIYCVRDRETGELDTFGLGEPMAYATLADARKARDEGFEIPRDGEIVAYALVGVRR